MKKPSRIMKYVEGLIGLVLFLSFIISSSVVLANVAAPSQAGTPAGERSDVKNTLDNCRSTKAETRQ